MYVGLYTALYFYMRKRIIILVKMYNQNVVMIVLGGYSSQTVVAVVTFLEERRLPFIGHDEHIRSRHISNFPGVVELIRECEPCLAKHVDEFDDKGATKAIIYIVNKMR